MEVFCKTGTIGGRGFNQNEKINHNAVKQVSQKSSRHQRSKKKITVVPRKQGSEQNLTKVPAKPRCVAGVIILKLQPRNVATLDEKIARVATLRGWSIKIIVPATQRGNSGACIIFCSHLVFLDNRDFFLAKLLIHQYNHDMPSLFFVQDDRSLC